MSLPELSKHTEPVFTLRHLRDISRLLGVLLGLTIIVIGLYYACGIFGVIRDTLRAPEGFGGTVEAWVDVLKIDEESDAGPAAQIRAYRMGRVVAVGTIALGLFLLVQIATVLMVTGAKLVSLASGDAEAVRAILKSVFGPGAIARIRGQNKDGGFPGSGG